jgi:CRISPR-associated protein Csx16
MASYLVTRHAGAVEWARRQGIVAEWRPHFEAADLAGVSPGDAVIGPLPVQLIAEVNACGGRYLNIEMQLGAGERGRELSADDMERLGARLIEYRVARVTPGSDSDTGRRS